MRNSRWTRDFLDELAMTAQSLSNNSRVVLSLSSLPLLLFCKQAGIMLFVRPVRCCFAWFSVLKRKSRLTGTFLLQMPLQAMLRGLRLTLCKRILLSCAEFWLNASIRSSGSSYDVCHDSQGLERLSGSLQI